MKQRNTFHRAFSLLMAVLMLVACAGTPSAYAAENWSLTEDTEIFLIATSRYDDTLEAQVKLFAAELAEKVTGTALPISYGDDSLAGANDIILALDSSSGIAGEGYTVSVSSGNVKISASTADGLFYGCRYLIKELMLKDSVAPVSDAPHVSERAVSLDNGRMYFSAEWIKEFIREMSWANMNTLVLHFSEEMGLGIESRLYPWLNGRDGTLCTQAEVPSDNRYLTQEEVAEIMEYAALYHIDVVPSLDSPGHMNYIVKKFNEQCADKDFSFTYRGTTYTAEAGSEIGNYYHYNGKTSIVKGSRNANYSRGIDVSNEVAVAFTQSLIEEYAKLFARYGSTKIDIGGDELLGWGSAIVSGVNKWEQLDHWKVYAQERTGNTNAVAYDAFLLYMNDLNDLVRDLGYTSVRMWNDDALRFSDTGWTGAVQLDTNIDIWFWTTGKNIFYDYAIADYQLYNILSDYNYYAMTSDYFSSNRGSFTQAYPDQIYNEWTPYIFYPNDLNAGWQYNPGQTNPNVLGGAFGVWCDNPTLRTQSQVMDDLIPLIRANAAKSWNPNINQTVSYSTYTDNWATYGAAPEGNVAVGDIYVPADLSALEEAVAEFDAVDGTLYTAESYTAYTEAVEIGKALLAAEKPRQSDVDAAEETICAAFAALVLRPTTDTAALEEAIAQYEAINAEVYTEESYAVYKAAAEEAKLLLASGIYTQDEVDAALEALNAAYNSLQMPSLDTSALEAAIAEYAAMDASLYTEESFSMYASAVQKAQELLDSGTYTQGQVDSALAAIQTQKEALRKIESVGGTVCFISGDFKSSKVYVGKVATINMSVIKGTDIAGFEVYNDLGTTTEIIRSAASSQKSDRDNYMLMFSPTETEVGTRTYTIYAVLGDGTRSADSLTMSVTIK